VKTQRQSATGLAYKACFRWFSMEPSLDQRRRYANVVNKTHNGDILRCKFNVPREGKLDNFSFLESLKNVKGDSNGVPFSKVV
jgi:hypothetical protein